VVENNAGVDFNQDDLAAQIVKSLGGEELSQVKKDLFKSIHGTIIEATQQLMDEIVKELGHTALKEGKISPEFVDTLTKILESSKVPARKIPV